MPSHHLITDPYLHEPKGISTANEGMVYVSSGGGTGQWIFWPYGQAYYQHDTAGQVITTAASRLSIDSLGLLTNENYLPREVRGIRSLWDSSANKLMPIRQGDCYQISVNLDITTETSTPTELTVLFDGGVGSTPTNILKAKYLKLGRTTPYTVSVDTVVGVFDSTVLSNGIQILLLTDTGSVTLGTPSIQIVKTVDGVV